MSFFSGYLMGRAISGNSGGVAGGFYSLFVFGFIILAVAATMGAFLLPLYSIVHGSLWGYKIAGGVAATSAAILMALIVPPSYAMALLGSRKDAYIGCGTLAAIAFAVVLSLGHLERSPLHGVEFLMKDGGEQIANAFLTAVLCMVSTLGFRFLCVKFMSQDRRDRFARNSQQPLKWVTNAQPFAWAALALALFFTVIQAWMVMDDHQRIDRFMEETGRSYEDAFQFVYFANTCQEDMTTLLLLGLFTLLTAVHLVFLRRRKLKFSAGQPQAAR
ncbi:hypothetical protein K4L04_03945 [Phaeobacter inhibens]|uniref:hypothetical protein n=1 Tax=Phaeobacter inhibens TaxID=221822 RepID=UPI0021A43EC6|nr:hypothetical protein [Phaeobacter inhibens]UWR77121.1 hypothetical protein K4L04_03945 [Phaeobacter inhibens]